MFDPKQLGSRIKSLRVQKGLSQDKLAEAAGLNGKYLGEVERGQSNISIVNLAKIAEVLDVPLVSILETKHEQGREFLVKELYKMIDAADDKQIIMVYRIIESIIR